MISRRHLLQTIAATALAVCAIGSLSRPARALLLVKDPFNLIENILTAIRELIQINNQLVMLTKQQGAIDRIYAQQLIYAATEAVSGLSSRMQLLAEASQYDQAFGQPDKRMTEDDLSKSWDDPRRLSHFTTQTSFKLLQQQLPTTVRQAEQIRANLALIETQDGIVGSIQATGQMLGSLGDQLASLQTVAAQQLRGQAAETARSLQERERDLEAHRRFMQPLPRETPKIGFWGQP